MSWNQVENVAQRGSTASLNPNAMSSLLNATDFTANDVVSFSMEERTFIAINDARNGFQGESDTLIEITGFTGNLADLAIG